jgi:glycosyltransferase involved in cell wall biosynthesis
VKIAWFTESRMMADRRGVFTRSDEWPHFIAPLAQHCQQMTLASTCRYLREGEGSPPEKRDYLPLSNSLVYEPLPSYENTEDFYRRAPMIIAAAIKPLRRIIDSHDIIAIRYHNLLAPLTEFLAYRAGKPVVAYWAGPPILTQVRRNYPENSFRHRLARAVAWMEQTHYAPGLAKRAALNFFIDQEEYELMGPPNGNRTHWVIPMLVRTTEILKPQKRTGNKFQMVYAGHLVRHKGVFELIEAVAELVKDFPGLRLVMAGDGAAGQSLEALVRQRQLEGVVNFLGRIARQRLFEVLSQSHVLVHPTWAEGLPKIIWEAWAAGLPIITTPAGSIARHVRSGVNGLLIPPGQPRELAAAIRSLLIDEEKRYNLALGGNETVQRYSWDAQISSIAMALEKVLL